MTKRVLLLAALLLPSGAAAQLQPRVLPGGSDPTRPQPMPAQAEPVARVMAYQRLRLSVETYPLLTHARASGYGAGGASQSWISTGLGTRADYRISHRWSAVGELTSSWAGSPVTTNSLELGARYRPATTTDGRVQPFVDARGSWAMAYERPFGDSYAQRERAAFDRSASSGFGALAGAGIEYFLTSRWSAVTSASIAHNAMTEWDAWPADSRGFGMTTYRLLAGLKYYRVQALTAQDAAGR